MQTRSTRCQTDRFADEERVVHDVVVRQRGVLWASPVVPDVNWMLIGSSNCSRAPALDQATWPRGRLHGCASSSKFRRPGDRSAPSRIAWRNDGTRRRRDTPQDRDDSRLPLKPGARISAWHPTVFTAYSSSLRMVRRVDVDQDQSCFGGRELGQHPLRAVRRPDAEPVAGFEPEPHEAESERVDALFQLPVGPADLLMRNDERFALGVHRGRPRRRSLRSWRRGAADRCAAARSSVGTSWQSSLLLRLRVS